MTQKIIIIGVIVGACFLASLSVMGLVVERQQRSAEVSQGVGDTWGRAQAFVGPVLRFERDPVGDEAGLRYRYLLPESLTVESIFEPEVRSRGIFSTTVYVEKLKVVGSFRARDIGNPALLTTPPTLILLLSDTRSIEKQVALEWQGDVVPFQPGSDVPTVQGSGMHANLPHLIDGREYPFSFELELKGAERATFAPVGRETLVQVRSSWPKPEFIGAFLPSERTIDESGFTATWRVSSFGRTYPQTWDGDSMLFEVLHPDGHVGIRFFEGVDFYTQLTRSIKYAILFIVVTFSIFFLYEVLASVRVHAIQYLLIGAALALFYLLLLSFAEQIGFLAAYVVASSMIVLMVTGYSASVLKHTYRVWVLFLVLSLLYTYLYFVLKLEDYALIFGALLLFVLLATIMYLTRRIDWFAIQPNNDTTSNR